MRDLVCDFLRAFLMLELVSVLVVLPLVGTLVVLPLVCQLVLEFMSVFVVLPLVRGQLVLEFVSVLVVLPLVRGQLVLAQSLAGNPAQNGAERTADRGADHRRGDTGYRAKNGCRAADEAPDASSDPSKELVCFELVLLELVGSLMVFPLQLAFMLLELAEAPQFPFELQLQFAFIRGRHVRRPSLCGSRRRAWTVLLVCDSRIFREA